MVMGEGKSPTHSHLLVLAKLGDIKKEKAVDIIEEVSCVISKWSSFAQEAQVHDVSQKRIQKSLDQLKKDLT